MEGKIKNKIIIISKLNTIEPFKKSKIVLHEFRAKVHNWLALLRIEPF